MQVSFPVPCLMIATEFNIIPHRSGDSMPRRIVALFVVLAATCTCAGLAIIDVRAAGRAADSPGYWGFETANLDKTCKPCDDFFQFAMGGWMKNNPIPAEYSTYGSFTRLADRNQKNLRQILEDAAKAKPAPGADEQKNGEYYARCMDTAAIDAAGTKPIEPELGRIADIKSIADLQAEAERLQSMGVGALFRFTS